MSNNGTRGLIKAMDILHTGVEMGYPLGDEDRYIDESKDIFLKEHSHEDFADFWSKLC